MNINICHKWKILLLLLVVLLVNSFILVQAKENSVFIDSQIEKELKVSSELQVVVVLKEVENKKNLHRLESLKKEPKKIKIEKFRENSKQRLKLLEELIFDLQLDKSQVLRKSITGRWLYVNLTREELEVLKSNPKITSVTLPGVLRTYLNDSVPLIKASEVWQMEKLGVHLNGSGQTVCVIDTGIDDHAALENKVLAEKCFCSSCCPNGLSEDSDAKDEEGHGTHVAGIIASTDNTYKGVAPESKIVAVKTSSKNLAGTKMDLADAIDWCVNKSETYDISIISMSVGPGTPFATYSSEFSCGFWNGLWSAGISGSVSDAIATGLVIVAATGNDEDPNGVSSPACLPHVIGIGSSSKNDIFDEDSNGKNSGLLDLLAPGVSIKSLKADGTSDSYCTDDGIYRTCSGTSMATPHVSGAVALLLQRDSSLKPDQIKKLLQDTGESVTGSDKKRINIKAAMDTYYPTIGQTVHRDVYEGQTMTFDVEGISQQHNGKYLEFELNWDTGDTLYLIVEDPNGDKTYYYTGNRPTTHEQLIYSPYHGTWKVHVNGNSTLEDTDYVDFDLSVSLTTSEDTDDVEDGVDDNTGGVNFSNINLNYISTCDSDELDFVMKGTEAQAGETYVNFINQTELARDTFLTGLVIPNDEQWISLPIMVNNISIGGDSMGEPAFLATKAADRLLKADVELKYDMFQDSQPIVEELVAEWKTMVQSSPYYSQMQAQNFNTFPSYAARAWITPEGITANGSGCKVFIQNSTLEVDVVMEGVWLDLSSYSFSQEVLDELETLRQNWSSQLYQGFLNYSNQTEIKINNNSEYADLRTIFNSLALAQWYKNQDWSQVPYGDLIDTSNTSPLNLNTSFDESYWEAQAWQELYTFQFTSFLGETWNWNVHGGVTLDASEPDVTGDMSNATEDLMENATTNAVAQDGDDYYFSVVQQVSKPDITPTALWVNTSLTPDANESIMFFTTIENEGATNFTSNFTVYFYYSYTYPTGYTVIREIGNKSVSGLNTGDPKQVNITWSNDEVGNYNIFAEVDYDDDVEELSEINNQISRSVEIVDYSPTASIKSPLNGAQHQWDELIVFAGYGTDHKDAELNESLYNWTSDVDGYLGNEDILYANLSEGDHVIYFTVEDSDGNTNTDQVLISVVPSVPPVASINSPINGQTFIEGEIVYFVGEALDHEDGDLTGSSLSWNSSLDGYLGSGITLTTTSLSPGTHNISFVAEDSSGVTDTEVIEITVEESTPIVNITLPANNSDFFYYDNNITFNATATDPHEGDLSSQLNWTSNLDDNIGIGATFSKILSEGTHFISAFLTDEWGLIGLSQIYLTILPPQSPTVSIISPTDNQQITNGELTTFKGSATDPEDGDLSGNNITWNSSLDGNIGNGTEFNLSNFTVGEHEITLTAIDSDNLTAQAVINITVNSASPQPNIISPSSGDAFSEGASVLFNGTATDYEDGSLTGNSLVWTSNIDGQIGTGNNFTLSTLSKGAHNIILNATDSDGVSSTDSKTINIVGPGDNVLNTFSDGTSTKLLNYSSPDQKVVYVRLPKGANITSATLQIEGLSHEE